MMKNILFVIALFLILQVELLAQSTSLSGYVKMEETGAILLSATVILYQKGQLVKKTKADSLGYYKLNELKPGIYTIEADCPRCSLKRFENMPLLTGKAATLNIELLSKSIWMDEVTVTAYKTPALMGLNICYSFMPDSIPKIPILKMSVSVNPPTSQRSLDALVVQKTVNCSGWSYKKEFTTVYSLTASEIRLSRMRSIAKKLSR